MQQAPEWLLECSREIHLPHFHPQKIPRGTYNQRLQPEAGEVIEGVKTQIIVVLEVTFIWHTDKFAHIPMDVFATVGV